MDNKSTVHDVSVIIITRNEERNIERVIKSVLSETDGVHNREILLVDSASVDDTVARARQYPIRILRLHGNQRLTAAKGRCLGFRNSDGKYVLFLDGDCELVRGWLRHGIRILDADDGIAAVGGTRINAAPENNVGERIAPPFPDRFEIQEVRHFGGNGLYRRRVLDDVGCHNPHLFSDEEPDLAIRIHYARHRIVRTNYPIVYHYTPPPRRVSSVLARRKRNLYLGAGQNLRYHLGKPTFWRYAWERGFGITPTFVLAMGFMAAGLGLAGDARWLMAWAILIVGIFIALACRRKSVNEAVVSIVERLCIVEGTVRGFLKPRRSPATFADAYDMIDGEGVLLEERHV